MNPISYPEPRTRDESGLLSFNPNRTHSFSVETIEDSMDDSSYRLNFDLGTEKNETITMLKISKTAKFGREMLY